MEIDIKYILQRAVHFLEAYKRRLGRNYDQETHKEGPLSATGHRIFQDYNEIESIIRHLCLIYNLERKSKPYFLKR